MMSDFRHNRNCLQKSSISTRPSRLHGVTLQKTAAFTVNIYYRPLISNVLFSYIGQISHIPRVHEPEIISNAADIERAAHVRSTVRIIREDSGLRPYIVFLYGEADQDTFDEATANQHLEGNG
jgi:hypothetical protein